MVATTYAALDRGLLSASLWILVAGAWEGLALGSAQASVLRRMGVRPIRWVAVTVLAALLGYALSLAGGAGGPEAAASDAAEPPLWLIIPLGAGLGLAMGLMMGAIQWFAARGVFGFWQWTIANGIAWAPAMAIIMLAATQADAGWPLALIALLGALAGACAGLCIGAITGVVVRRAVSAGAQR